MAVALDDRDRALLAGVEGPGAAVAEELYGVRLPIGVLPAAELASIRNGENVLVGADGVVTTGRIAGHGRAG
jgi:hypothetical protein